MINCKYCHRPTRKIQRHQFQLINWQCDYHGGVIVRYLLSDNLSAISHGEVMATTILVCKWKEETYHVVFIYDPQDPIKFRIDKVLPAKYGRPEATEPIVTLDFLPLDITPENVMNKLPTYIIFS